MPYDLVPLIHRLTHTSTAQVGGRVETITYHARATASAVPVHYPGIPALVLGFSDDVVAMHALTPEPRILSDDAQLWIETPLVTWTPTIWDSVTREDGRVWRVHDIARETRSPSRRFQIRKTT